METMQAILTRRSIRKFKSDKVPKNIVDEILHAAMHAPSANNQQPWQFIVIEDRKILEDISKIHPYAGMCRTAAMAILVCADLKLEKSKDMWLLDCAAATQNILLSSHDKGLGSVWVGIYFRKDHMDNFKKLFKLPDNIIPISLIPIGYPDEQKKPEDRFIKERVHYNAY
ncbi:MAG: nitroreductase family protein [Parachlamydiales bacterium]|jgi:nitroreductase